MTREDRRTNNRILWETGSYRRGHYAAFDSGTSLPRSQVQLAFTVVKILSSPALFMKFPPMHRVGEVHTNQTLTRQCYLVSHQVKPLSTFPIGRLDTRGELSKEREEPAKDLAIVPLGDGNP